MGINKEEANIDTNNIFEEFVGNKELNTEINEQKQEYEKDKYHYILQVTKVLKYISIFIFLVIFVLQSYIFFQNKSNMSNISILDPICHIFIGSEIDTIESCSSVTYLNDFYEKELEREQKTQSDMMLSLVEKLYQLKNFHQTKEVQFLIEKTDSKLQVLRVLEDFDTMKNDYTGQSKDKIECENIVLNGDMLSAECSAYTAGFQNNIVGVKGKQGPSVSGTSITLANSFINYIDKNSDIFEVVNRQKSFAIESVVGDSTNYTHKTSFNLNLKYYYE